MDRPGPRPRQRSVTTVSGGGSIAATVPEIDITDNALVGMIVAGAAMATYGGGATISQIVSGSPAEKILDMIGIGVIPNNIQAAVADPLLAKHLGISAQEIGLIGASLIAAGTAGIGARQALKSIELMRSEFAEETPESRAQKLEILRMTVKDILKEIGPEAQGKLIESLDAAGILKEVFVVGSILPDEV